MASQATELWVHPVGSVSARGLGGLNAYQRELYKNLKVNFHNYSQGEFGFALPNTSQTCQKMKETRDRHCWIQYGMK